MRDRIADIIEKFVIDEGGGYFGRYEAADAIIAALPDMIAPLVWSLVGDWDFKAGQYSVWYATETPETGEVWMLEFAGVTLSHHSSEKTAKAAANAHNRAAIIAAFKEPTA